MSNDAALIAQFLATKGATKVATGERAVANERDFYVAAREGGKVETVAQRAEREDHQAYAAYEREWQADFASKRG